MPTNEARKVDSWDEEVTDVAPKQVDSWDEEVVDEPVKKKVTPSPSQTQSSSNGLNLLSGVIPSGKALLTGEKEPIDLTNAPIAEDESTRTDKFIRKPIDKKKVDEIYTLSKQNESLVDEFAKSHFVLDNLSQTEAIKQLNDLYAKREQAKDPQTAQAIDNQIEVIKSQPVEKQPSIQEAVLQNAQKYGSQPQDFNRPEIPMTPLTPNQILERNGMKTANTVGELHDRYIESATKLNELRPELDRTATELDAFKKDARTADFKTDKSGNKTLEGLADIPEAFGHGFGGTMKSIEQGFVNLLGDKQDRIDYAKKRYLEDNILYPTRTKGMATSGSEMIGGVAPYVISTAVLPETALLGHVITNGLTMGASGYGNGYYEMFAKQKQQGASDEEADAIAMQNAKFEGAKETAIGASLPFMGGAGSKLFLAPAEKSAMKQFLATQGVIIPTFTAGKLASNVYQKYGLGEKDVNLGDGLAETAENGLILGAMMEFAHKAPTALQKLYRVKLSDAYPEIQVAVDKAVKDGAIDASQGYVFTEKLKRDFAVFNAMPKDITTEQKLAIEPEVKQIIELSSREPSAVESPEVTKDKIVQLQKQVAEKLGTPLTEKEMKSYEKLQEIKGDKEDKLTPSEKLELNHYEKRIKTAEDNDVKLAEEKKVAEAETPTNVGVEEGSVGVGGDVGATTKALEEVAKKKPNASITFINKQGYEQKVNLNDTYEFTQPEEAGLKGETIKGFRNQNNTGIIPFSEVAEAYHKAKKDGSNPELVKAVEQSLKETPQEGSGGVGGDGKKITITGYRNKGSKDVGENGTFYTQSEQDRPTNKKEISFDNALVLTDEQVEQFEGLPNEYLAYEWFPDVDFTKEAKRQGISESGHLMDKMVTEEAIKRGYDGIVYGTNEIVDLRTHPKAVEQSLKETTIAETPTKDGNTSNVGVEEGSGGVGGDVDVTIDSNGKYNPNSILSYFGNIFYTKRNGFQEFTDTEYQNLSDKTKQYLLRIYDKLKLGNDNYERKVSPKYPEGVDSFYNKPIDTDRKRIEAARVLLSFDPRRESSDNKIKSIEYPSQEVLKNLDEVFNGESEKYKSEQSLKETTKAEKETVTETIQEKGIEEAGSVGGGRDKSDAAIEKRMAELEGAKIGTPELAEFNALEKEMEKRERDTVFNVPLENVNDAVDTLMKKEKEQPNGYGSFIEKRDARETKEVADRYLNAKDLTDAELKQDFSDAVRGNPTTWYADGLKMREALKEATNRGIDTRDMLAEVTKVYEDAGYDTETAKSVVAGMIKPILVKSQKMDKSATTETGKSGSGDIEIAKRVNNLGEFDNEIRGVTNQRRIPNEIKERYIEALRTLAINKEIGIDHPQAKRYESVYDILDANEKKKEPNKKFNKEDTFSEKSKSYFTPHELIPNVGESFDDAQKRAEKHFGMKSPYPIELIKEAKEIFSGFSYASEGFNDYVYERMQESTKKTTEPSLSQKENKLVTEEIKTAIDNGEITREQVDGFTEQDESAIEDIERKAESENEAELNEAIDQTDKLIGEAVGATESKAEPTDKGTSESKVTGITKAVQEQEWKELGVDSDFANQLSRDWDGTVLKEAKDKIKANPYIAETLAKELNDNPRPTTDTENAILLIEKRRLQNLFDEHYNDTSEDKNPIALLAIQDKLIENMNAIEGAGTKLGQGLNSLKMLMAKDYSLATMLAKKRLANDNKPLTPEVEKQITDLHEKITELQKKFDDYVEQKKKESEITDAENGLNRAKRDVRKNNRNLTREKLKAERDVIVSNIKDKVATLLESAVEKTGGKLNAVENKVNNKEVLSSLSLEISNLVKNLVEDKVLDLADIVDNIHDELKGIIPDLSKREVRDAISGYGKEPQKQTKSEIQSEIDRLKKEAKQLSKQEDIESGKIDEPRLKALKTRTANRIKELQEKIAKGDYSKKEKKVYELDDVALNLKAELDREKAKFSKGLQQDALSKRTLGEKGLDALAQWSRAIKLSGIVTLGKLTAAAAERVVITPAEEAVGGVLSKIFPKLSAKAEREGGINAKIEAQAISKGFMKGMADSWRILTTGESNLDVSYGKQDNLPHSVLDFFGHLHGALKAVPKRIEFERSFAKRMEAQAKKGIDVSNPLVQTKTAIQAYKDSKRAIFMQDNIVASAWSNFIKSLESKNKTTGEDNKVIATIGKTLLPFVKIPTNIVGETLTYAGGSVSGSYKLAKALTKGIENVSPEEADVVLRHLKKGSLGLGLLALGFFNPQAIGGYYQKYEKRREGEPEAGEVELFGHKIPKFLVHNPLLECLQIGATVRRVSDTYTKGKENTKTSGLMAGLLGIADEVPFVKTGESLKGALESEHEATYFLGSYLKGMIDPALLQDIARFTDKDENGKVKKRETDTVLEHIESGLPFLRQSLPEKEQKNRAVTTPLYDEKGKLLQHGRTR